MAEPVRRKGYSRCREILQHFRVQTLPAILIFRLTFNFCPVFVPVFAVITSTNGSQKLHVGLP